MQVLDPSEPYLPTTFHETAPRCQAMPCTITFQAPSPSALPQLLCPIGTMAMPLRAPRGHLVAQESSVAMSPQDSARSHAAASWNQHCAPPEDEPECRNSSWAVAEAGIPFGAAVATCAPSSHTSTPVPGVLRMMTLCVCRCSSAVVSTVCEEPGNRISRVGLAVLSAASTVVVPAVSSEIAPVRP